MRLTRNVNFKDSDESLKGVLKNPCKQAVAYRTYGFMEQKWVAYPRKGSLTIVFCSVEWDKPDDLQTLGQGMQHNSKPLCKRSTKHR